MAEQKNAPQIRVAGFTVEWTKQLLNHYLETSQEKNIDGIYKREDVLSVSGDYGVVHQIEFKGRSFAGASVCSYCIVHTGDVVYTKSPLKENPYGIIKTNTGKAGIVSTLYAVYHPKEFTFPQFVQWYFENNDRLNHYLTPLVNKGAKNDMKLSADNALLGTVIFPDYAEQKAISDSLTHIKNTILQCESRLKKLQTLKASMMEKMFPKDGAVAPKVRFNGFSGAWERKYGSELFTAYVDKGHPELPVLSATQDAGMVARHGIGKSVFHNTANEIGYKRVMPGQFVIHLRSFQGGFAHSAVEGITSPAYTVFGFKEPEKHDDYYWKYVFTSKQFIKRLETVTYGIRDGRSISYEEFLTLDFLFPQKEEQTKICTYLRELDRIIFLRQQELDKLQSIRKALLEKMFV